MNNTFVSNSASFELPQTEDDFWTKNGEYHVFGQYDSTDRITESNELDNVVAGSKLVFTSNTSLTFNDLTSVASRSTSEPVDAGPDNLERRPG